MEVVINRLQRVEKSKKEDKRHGQRRANMSKKKWKKRKNMPKKQRKEKEDRRK
jgi:hypothetical protein